MSKRTSSSSGNARFSYISIDLPSGEILSFGRKNAYELVFITSGIGVFHEDSIEYRLTRGSLILCRPSEVLKLSVSESLPFEGYSVSFTLKDFVSEAEHILDSVLASASPDKSIITSSYSPEKLLSVFERFECADGMPKDEKTVYFKMLISEIIIFLSLADNKDGIYEERELGARARRYLDENIERQISLDDLARRFFVSKFYLCRAFKKYNGISPHSYINNKRVAYAKQLIESGESASGAAYKVGFGDYSAFYRAYVKVFGKSPTLDKEGGEEV